MFSKFFRKNTSTQIPQQIYGSLMAQARSEFLYARFGVPDTVMGRFDMLAMHVYLVARRLRNESNEIFQSLSQDIFDLFVADIERALRELGIGDTTVPKRKKKMVRSFYGQIDDFDKILVIRDLEKLEEAVNNRYLNGIENCDAKALAEYMLQVEVALENQQDKDLLEGNIHFTV